MEKKKNLIGLDDKNSTMNISFCFSSIYHSLNNDVVKVRVDSGLPTILNKLLDLNKRPNSYYNKNFKLPSTLQSLI